jgi:5-methylcytosine-specific restriction protein B
MTSPDVNQVILALTESKNVLLYGPPGTGKTWLLSNIVKSLKNRKSSGGKPSLKLGAASDPFGTLPGGDVIDRFPKSLEIEWVTFHQSYSYEEFIIGKRPKPVDGGLILEPNFGVLMNIAVKITDDDGKSGCLLIIDEINRANASQVFGEFITLLDPDYRKTINGKANEDALKIRLPGINYKDGLSEEIVMLSGNDKFKLSEDWTFPENVYVLATMNSVDKAALPLDSALTRRFHRIEMAPDIALLASKLDVVISELTIKVKSINNSTVTIDSLSAEEVAILLLDRLNVQIANEIGEDFELGHALMWQVVKAKPEARWEVLFSVWDNILLPQIMDRFSGQNDSLRDLLKVQPSSPTANAFFDRTTIGSDIIDESSSFKILPLKSLSLDIAKTTLRNIAV